MSALEPPLPGAVNEEISQRDGMFAGSREHYFSVGASALRAIRLALLAAGRPDPRRILDLPSGHGRVLRMLRAAWPEALITACDLDRDGVDYCARTFGAVAVPSAADPGAIPLADAEFDLIWCGSLLTHLDAPLWASFLRLFRRVLAPSGVLVFTTHGRRPAQWLRDEKTHFGLEVERVYGLPRDLSADLLASYTRGGFGYVDYPGQQGYGISVASPSWVTARIEHHRDLRIVGWLEHGWDEHQDVIACVREDA